MGKSQKSGKPYGRATPNWIPQSGIHFSPSLSQAKDYPLINVRKILDTTLFSLSTFPPSIKDIVYSNIFINKTIQLFLHLFKGVPLSFNIGKTSPSFLRKVVIVKDPLTQE